MITMRCRTPARFSMPESSAGARTSTRFPACTATPACEPCEVSIRTMTSLSRSIRSPAARSASPIDAMVTSRRVFVLARTMTEFAPRRCATMLAAPFASLSNTLCAPYNPKARIVTFGFSPADAQAENADAARSPAVRNLMSLLRIMTRSSLDRRQRNYPWRRISAAAFGRADEVMDSDGRHGVWVNHAESTSCVPSRRPLMARYPGDDSECERGRRPRSDGLIASDSSVVVLEGDVLAGIVRHQGGRCQADDGAGEDVNGNCVARLVSGEQRRRNERCWPTGSQRGELIAER